MLEINIPNLTAENITEKIVTQLQNENFVSTNEIIANLSMEEKIQKQIGYIQGFINTAKLRSQERNTWPNSLNRFPFILFKPFNFILLKILKFLFKDQKEVNYNVIQTAEELLVLNTDILNQISQINSSLSQEVNNLYITNNQLKQENKKLESTIEHLENIINLDLQPKTQQLEHKLWDKELIIAEINEKNQELTTKIDDSENIILELIDTHDFNLYFLFSKTLAAFMDKASHLLVLFMRLMGILSCWRPFPLLLSQAAPS